jgi:DNA-binding NtrC family response regulator
MTRQVERVLVVEDDRALQRAVERALSERFPEVRSCRTRAEALELLRTFRPELLVLDVQLPDGDAVDVLRAAAGYETAPVVVSMSGAARADQTFELGTLGVRAFLPKPLAPGDLERAVDAALSTPPDLRPLVRASVGHRPIHEVEDEVRATMIDEALAQSTGSRRAAARILAISRQLLQHMLRRRRDTDPLDPEPRE